jgi:hypothetical protein
MGLFEPHVGYGCGYGEADLNSCFILCFYGAGSPVMSERIESVVDPTAEPAPAPVAAMGLNSAKKPSSSDPKLEQMARIEEKLARMEEKLARFEAVQSRAEARLDRATDRVEEAARSVDAAELAREVVSLREVLVQKPGMTTLIQASLITTFSTVIVFILLLMLFPGLVK